MVHVVLFTFARCFVLPHAGTYMEIVSGWLSVFSRPHVESKCFGSKWQTCSGPHWVGQQGKPTLVTASGEGFLLLKDMLDTISKRKTFACLQSYFLFVSRQIKF